MGKRITYLAPVLVTMLVLGGCGPSKNYKTKKLIVTTTKPTYNIGDTISKDQIKVRAIFNDDTEGDIEWTCEEFTKENDYTYTFTQEDIDAEIKTFTVVASDKRQQNITVQSKQAEGKVLNIFISSDHFDGSFKDYCIGLLNKDKDKYYYQDHEVRFITPSKTSYVTYLDEVKTAIEGNEEAYFSNKIDLFLNRYTVTNANLNPNVYLLQQDDYSLDLQEVIPEESYNSIIDSVYPYTLENGKNKEGKLKSLAYMIEPEVIVYRNSIAKDVFGTDDPNTIKAKFSSKENIAELAATLHDKSYYLFPCIEENFGLYVNGNTTEVVNESKEINVPDSYLSWYDTMKTYIDEEHQYVVKGKRLQDEYNKQIMKDTGKTFAFIGSDRQLNTILFDDPEGTVSGDLTVIKGFNSYAKDELEISVAKGTDNKELAGLFLADLFSAKYSGQKQGVYSVVNNQSIVANDTTTTYAKYGGQNPMSVYNEAALACSKLVGRNDPYNDYAYTRFLEMATDSLMEGTTKEELIKSYVDDVRAYIDLVKI